MSDALNLKGFQLFVLADTAEEKMLKTSTEASDSDSKKVWDMYFANNPGARVKDASQMQAHWSDLMLGIFLI